MAPSKANCNHAAGTAQQETSNPEDDVPACQSCRRKKAKCSREQPCSQCVRFSVDCVYDERRSKPGLRTGAVEQLQRRVETLENMFLGQGILWQQVWPSLHPNTNLHVLSHKNGSTSQDVQHQSGQLKESLIDLAVNHGSSPQLDSSAAADEAPPAKRQRLDSSHDARAARIPSDEAVDELVEFYFANVHHWIPVLHVRRFREQIRHPKGREKASQILDAIVAVCVRFSNHPCLGDEEAKAHIAKTNRQRVILSSMESFSVENLQALVIIAFDTIGSGRGPSSWSIVGSMTRTVEQLQLSIEEEDISQRNTAGENLLQRMVFLSPSKCWSEAEERRRVFWAVFLMDRFCSVSTGWNLSLTNADVRRRLPCEGALWEKETEVQAPHFGISDKRSESYEAAGIGGNQALLDAQHDSIGGLAHCIEAAESLSLVTQFFLQHAVDVSNSQQVQRWLIKFKKLDLRLVQWKLFLPAKWREASVLNDDGVMDPNLTLAHITHNTSVILLHQGIAYPPPHWRACPVRLPSASSAETCIEAASEISTIGHQFLRCSVMLASPQFSFCLFVAGRMLLTHSAYNKTPVPLELETLIASLLEISRRWEGPQKDCHENLASVFAKRLIRARDKSSPALPQTSLDIRQTAYSESTDDSCHAPRQASEGLNSSPGMGDSPFGNQLQNNFINPPSLAFPPLPLSFQQPAYQQQIYQSQASIAPFPTPDPSIALPNGSLDGDVLAERVSAVGDNSSGEMLSPTSYHHQSAAMTTSKSSHMPHMPDSMVNSMAVDQWFDGSSGFLDLPFGPSQRISRYGKAAVDQMS